jgi:hypothetical protein
LSAKQLVLPHLSTGRRGPASTLGLQHSIFNYMLQLLYMGCQWKVLPIEMNDEGNPEIHYTRIYRALRRWQADDCIDRIFAGSVRKLDQDGLLELTVVHGDGTTTAAKKGGDNLGYSGQAPQGRQGGRLLRSLLLRDALPRLSHMARAIGMDLYGSMLSLDGVCDYRANRRGDLQSRHDPEHARERAWAQNIKARAQAAL